MNLLESTRIAMRGLAANKLRAVLTMLGIIIGVGAVITLLSVGQGVEKLITEQLQGAGTNLLFAIPININDSSNSRPAWRGRVRSVAHRGRPGGN